MQNFIFLNLCWSQTPKTMFRSDAHMGLVARNHCLRGFLQSRFKSVSSATETSWNITISLVASPDVILSNKLITKALIRQRGCTGWSVPVLFANLRRQVFSRQGPYINGSSKLNCIKLDKDAINREWVKVDVTLLLVVFKFLPEIYCFD